MIRSDLQRVSIVFIELQYTNILDSLSLNHVAGSLDLIRKSYLRGSSFQQFLSTVEK